MYNKKEMAILALDYFELTYAKMHDIVMHYFNVQDIFEKSKQEFLRGILSSDQLALLSNSSQADLEKIICQDLDKFDIRAITFCSSNYPEYLKNLTDPPLILYCIGNGDLLKEQKIGIVGTRKPTNYGRDVTNMFAYQLSEAGLVTVSGLSYGIDTCAAEATLKANGKTIAVLAGGLDNIYPAQNQELSRRIVKNGGLLVSEYRPYVRPKQYTFISRNRIVSGLSDGLLVVEAGSKSGTKSTANFCIDQGRELFVIPGNIFSPQSAGTNELINEIPDCFTISVSQILDRLHVADKRKQNIEPTQLDLLENNIIKILENGDAHFDTIGEQLNISASELSSKLTMMEIMGQVHKEAGNYYSLAH